MKKKSKATIEKYIHDVTAFYKWLSGRELTKDAVLKYKAEIVEKYAPASVNSILASLNSFFNQNELYGLRLKNLKNQKRIFCQSEKELTKQEYERLLKVAKDKNNEKLYLLMQTICATGIRVSELKFITAEAVKCGQAQVKLKGKIRIILLPKELCRVLKQYIKNQDIQSGCIFRTRNGKPIDRCGIWKAMKSLCEIAGVSREKVFPHNLRDNPGFCVKSLRSLQDDI